MTRFDLLAWLLICAIFYFHNLKCLFLTLTQYFSDSNEFKTICVFLCRGLEPIELDPKDGWTAQGCTLDTDEETSTIFTGIDLSNKESWSDFDGESKRPTMISEFEYNFVTMKH